MTVMSLSPLLVATSSVENAVFSQYAGNNALLRGGGGERTGVSGLSQPVGKRYRYLADSHTWHRDEERSFRVHALSALSRVESGLLPAFDSFSSSTRKRRVLHPSQSAYALHCVAGVSRVMAILSRSSSPRGNLLPLFASRNAAYVDIHVPHFLSNSSQKIISHFPTGVRRVR